MFHVHGFLPDHHAPHAFCGGARSAFTVEASAGAATDR
ncbi:hypothetical protein N177_2661 [Lutibaculum baratangense AMV1]|uniref:Uncharacterized protein n=1 Tax=Lutibaculum baratangense AMV1 TaxID=631454 RepID=V4QWR5_9HYPH|nr:hypothetical protein N177_2661 [Lutibaculum baratangense AMV1]